jgi:hypothetical protein
MIMNGPRLRILDDRGVALPLALVTLAILSALMIALTTLAASEPDIANNHLQSARARTFAESGLERALWAVNNPAEPGGLSDPLPPTLPADYGGSRFTWVERVAGVPQGGFKLTVVGAASGSPWERDITSVGFAPDDLRPRAVKKLKATAMRIRPFRAPCAACVNGALRIDGNSTVDARPGPSTVPGAPRHCAEGPLPTGSMSSKQTEYGVGPRVFGPGNDIPNEAADREAFVPAPSFAFQLTPAETAALKALAQSARTYYRGGVRFGVGNPLPQGLVFVDTTTGAPLTAATPDAEIARVSIEGGPPWRGWLVVAGSLVVEGDARLEGMLYAQNDLALRGGDVHGVVVAEERKATASSIDPGAAGQVSVTYDCGAIDAVAVPKGWLVQSGSYREVEGR